MLTKPPNLTTRIAPERWALLPLRLVTGFGFAFHGYAKLTRGPEAFALIVSAMGLPAPKLFAWLTVLLELAGGCMLMAGALTPLLAPPLVVIMLAALLRVHLPYGFSSVRLKALTPAGAQFGPVGYELNLLYIAALLALALAGPTPFSVDRWRAARHPSRDAAPRSRAARPPEERDRVP